MTIHDQISECIGLLLQSATVIADLDNRIFTAVTPISPRGSIGGHLRHILDFYTSFIDGCVRSQVDYNYRVRDTRLEQDRVLTLARIDETISKLKRLTGLTGQEHLLVSSEDGTRWCRSSILRELEFLESHTIHHYSLIAMLLRLHEVEPGEEFGVAPSTLKHWKQELLCAR